jgi:CzcA family heavy metal efflux pump
MLKALVDFSLRYRPVVLVLAVVVILYGVYTSYHAKLDVFPDWVPPQATVQTEAPGMSPEQVEELVTRPVENAINGVGNLESIRSQSVQGLSIVTAIFKEGANIFTARQMISEKLATISSELPVGVHSPKMAELTSSTMDLLKIGLVSDKLSPMELRTFVNWTLQPRLLAVPGVAALHVFGGEIKQLQIQLKPDRLIGLGLSVDNVLKAARQSTGARGAGFVDTPNQRIILQTEGQMLTPEQLGEVVITSNRGTNVRLKDVAKVVVGREPMVGDTVVMGRSGVLVTMLSQYGANTMDVTHGLEEALEDFKPVFAAQGITMYSRLHRPATFIENALHHMKRSLTVGAVLVAVVLFLFLFNLRAAFISITAIPLSLLIAVLVLDYFGLTLNTITLGGLAIAIGEVVDDAIIDVENIYRRLKENVVLGRPRSIFRVVLDASLEVRSAVVYATFVVVLVFVPVLTMSGLQGRLFAPLGWAYILAILASLLVALTVTPALSLLLLPGAAERREPRFLKALKAAYGWIITRVMAAPQAVMSVAALLVVATVALIPTFGGEFLPEFREGHFVLQVNGLPGTSMGEMKRVGKSICDELLSGDEFLKEHVATIEQQIGRAELGEDPWGPHRSEFHVELKPDIPGKVQAEVQEKIRDVLAGYPGFQTEVLTFLGDRIGETISGETASVVINLFGDDLDVLDAKAEQIAGLVRGVKGAADVRVASPPGSPQMFIQLRPEKLKELGFQPVEVLDAIQTAYQGVPVAQTYEGNKVFDVVVTLGEELRQDPEAIGSLMLRNGSGAYVRLDQLAYVDPRTGRYMIMHDGARRRQAVTCNVEGRDIAKFVDEAKAKVADVKLPAGVYTVFTGTAEARSQARNEILLHSCLAGIGVLLLLSTVFHRTRNLLLVLANLPFALVGGILAAWLTGGSLSVGSLVGFVTLFGITMRNSVMMISHYDHLVTQEGMIWGVPAAVRGASERILPVLMTALVTGLGLLPIALGTGEVGREIEGPMAIVILGGLITSTALNLLILPTLALRFGHFGPDERQLA